MTKLIIKLDGDHQGKPISLENAPAHELQSAISGLIAILRDENSDPTLSLVSGCVEVSSPVKDLLQLRSKVAAAKQGKSTDSKINEFIDFILDDKLAMPRRMLILRDDLGADELLIATGESMVQLVRREFWEETHGYLKGRLCLLGDNKKHENFFWLEINEGRKSNRVKIKADLDKITSLNRSFIVTSNVHVFVKFKIDSISGLKKDYELIRVAGQTIDPLLIKKSIERESLAWKNVDTEEWYKEIRG